MQYFGDIELVNGKIINLKVDPVTVLPAFSVDDASRLVYFDQTLYYNNGDAYVPLQIASESSQPLIDTLGSNWINPDYSFNPTPFNNLANISGLTSSDSLFTVIEKLDEALSIFGDINLNDINQISVDNLAAGQILYFDGTNFINVNISQIPDFSLSISLDSLTDVIITGIPSDNEVLVYDSSVAAFINKQTSFVYEQNSAQSIHQVIHNLNQLYCTITVINPLTSTLITDITSVVFNSPSQLTVTLGSSQPAVIFVTTIPLQ